MEDYSNGGKKMAFIIECLRIQYACIWLEIEAHLLHERLRHTQHCVDSLVKTEPFSPPQCIVGTQKIPWRQPQLTCTGVVQLCLAVTRDLPEVVCR